MRRRRLGTSSTWQAAALCSIAVLAIDGGCVDIDPVTVEPVFVDAAPPPTDAGDTPCGMCITSPSAPGPGCGDQIAACLTDERCTAVLECSAPLRCYEKPTPAEVNDCGLPCFRMVVGNTLPTDLIMLLLDIAACAQDTCGPICHPPQARQGPDFRPSRKRTRRSFPRAP
jgi:hypothetical protein